MGERGMGDQGVTRGPGGPPHRRPAPVSIGYAQILSIGRRSLESLTFKSHTHDRGNIRTPCPRAANIRGVSDPGISRPGIDRLLIASALDGDLRRRLLDTPDDVFPEFDLTEAKVGQGSAADQGGRPTEQPSPYHS